MEEIDGGRNSLKSLKVRNRLQVLSFLRNSGAVSVSEIAKYTSLSKMTVHKIIDHYIDSGMVVLAGKGGSTEDGGKKPNLFAFNPNRHCVFGIRFAEDHYSTCLLSLTGEFLISNLRLPYGDIGFDEMMNRAGESFNAYFQDPVIQERRLTPENCLAAVVGINGIVNPDGTVSFACMPNCSRWGKTVALREKLQERLPSHVRVHIDSWWRHLAHFELATRDPERTGKFFLIGNSGEYVSGGLVAEGKVTRGANGLAGEIGHLLVDPNGKRLCSCGGYGCLESMVAPDQVADQARARRNLHPESGIFARLDAGERPIAALTAEAAKGDALGKELLRETAGHFAVAINNVVQICDPGLVILYGDYAGAGDLFMDTLREKFSNLTLRGIDKKTHIEPSNLVDENGAPGAAYLVAETLCSADHVSKE